MTEKQKVINSLKPLFERAEKEGLWFYSGYQGFWITPQALHEHHKKGSFIWGAVNWELRDPKEFKKPCSTCGLGGDNLIGGK